MVALYISNAATAATDATLTDSSPSLPTAQDKVCNDNACFMFSDVSSLNGVNFILIGHGGLIYTSSNSGVSWTLQAIVNATNLYSISQATDSAMMIVGQITSSRKHGTVD